MNTRPPAPRKIKKWLPEVTDPAEIVVLVIVTLVFSVAFVFIVVDHLQDMWSGHQSATSWKKTKGTITVSEWTKSRYGTGRRRRTSWGAWIVYKYTLDGREFECSQVELPRTGRPRSWLQRYPQGSQVTVYYQPDDPANAVLQTGISRNAWISTLFGFTAVGGSLGTMVWTAWVSARRHRLRGRPPDPKKT